MDEGEFLHGGEAVPGESWSDDDCERGSSKPTLPWLEVLFTVMVLVLATVVLVLTLEGVGDFFGTDWAIAPWALALYGGPLIGLHRLGFRPQVLLVALLVFGVLLAVFFYLAALVIESMLEAFFEALGRMFS